MARRRATPPPPPEYPPLVWVASPEVVRGARLSADATALEGAGFSRRASLVPKIALNRSYFDATSAEFFARRTVKARGETRDGDFVHAHALAGGFPARPRSAAGAASARRRDADARRCAHSMRAEPHGGARARSQHRRSGNAIRRATPCRPDARCWRSCSTARKATTTRRTPATSRSSPAARSEDGAIGDWLVNNFYALDSESEKGILAAPVPLDNYLADLNSGQGWYRPSQMLVLVLAADRAAALVQAALNRTYNQFWRHQLPYRHATMNCTGISVDVLRALGWAVPARGPDEPDRGGAGLSLSSSAKERSVAKARVAFDYLVEDQTRLMPAAAFEECGAAALALAASGGDRRAPIPGRSRGCSPRTSTRSPSSGFPQFPSSRAFGDFPVVNAMGIPGAACPRTGGLRRSFRCRRVRFPDALRDPDLVRAPRPASDYAVAVWGALLVVGVVAGAIFCFETMA